MQSHKMPFCEKIIAARKNNKYSPEDFQKCFREQGHVGKCDEYPYLKHLSESAPRVKAKIVRDATKTTGAAWKSEDAGPNRISRWVMLLPDSELLKMGLNMGALKPGVVAKLRDKAATYEDCMHSAMYLTWSAYGMVNAPIPDDTTRQYLEAQFGPIVGGSTPCLICKKLLDFTDFSGAKRGKANIETAHAQPRLHTPGNVGFAHRDCNIAQGDKSLDQFYDWIAGILERARPA